MKKLFAILAAAFVVVACGGGAEKDEPATFEDQLVEYIEDMEEAVEDDDPEAALEALQSFTEWSQSIESTDTGCMRRAPHPPRHNRQTSSSHQTDKKPPQ